MLRRQTIFTGHVQGVGFRATAVQIARGYRVSGYVRNLSDGSVELVAEGDAKEIDAMLRSLSEKMEAQIRHRQDTDSPATGEFQNFSIQH